ncbi:hypothetical protein KBA41_03675 [Candidatus Ozemobacteraceae bacterium]|nr:hypothetical protein [Candidatus Ozemobacteraceae bacterium]
MNEKKDTYINTIIGKEDASSNPHRDYYAIESVVVADKETQPPPPATETARIQRCDKAGNNPLTPGHWFPSGDGVINPDDGFHGIQVGTEYHWRMDVASQAIFFQDLEKEKNATNYDYIADKLTNSEQPEYYVNGNPEFQFDRTGDDLRWAPGSTVEIQADLNYPVPPLTDDKPKVVQLNLGTNITTVDSQSFAYFTTKTDLPPTDPFEADLVIRMSRLFYYDMRIYGTINGVKRLLGKVPNLPKKLTIEAQTKVLIIDTVPPTIAFDKTKPTQLYGLTGKILESGTNDNPTSIQFQIRDNDPWDGLSGITSHEKYDSTNIKTNKETIEKHYGKAGSANYNLKPVFDSSNQGVQLYWNIASVTESRHITLEANSFKPSYGSFSPGTGLGTPVISNTAEGAYDSTMDFEILLSELNDKNPINLPKYYANNTPGYEPYKFWISLRDASGNESLDNLLNLVIHMKDDIPPDPYGIVQEYKTNKATRFPDNGGGAEDNDAFIDSFRNSTSFHQSFASRGNWYPQSPGEDKDCQIWDGSFDTGLKALWSVDDTIAALPDTMKNVDITPGDIDVEDNVEVGMWAGASDNAGAASATLTYRYFDIEKKEQTDSTSSSTFSLPGVTADADKKVQSSLSMKRVIFREGSIDFPLAIPITLHAVDDARNWDTYSSGEVKGDGTWSWGPYVEGASAPNERLFKTTLPVYGSELSIRTIETGVRTPGK